MSYEEEQQRKSRVVVETPTSRREVVQSQTERVPERRGISTGAVAALVVGAVALTVILFIFLNNNNKPDAVNANVNMTAAPTPIAPPPTVIQQPAPQVQQPPVIVQAPTAPTQPSTVVVAPPTSTTATNATNSPTSSTKTSNISDDVTIQSNVDKKLQDDPALSTLGIAAIVSNGKATLTGTVNSAALKRQAEQSVRSVTGVRKVDNQITVSVDINSNAPPY